MGCGLKLTDAEWAALDRMRFSTSSADVFRNGLIILLSDSRDTIASMAGRLGCSEETAKRIRKAHRNGGVDALRPIKPPGRPSRAISACIQAMKAAVASNPLTLGYGFSTWSVARLAAHLAQTTGIRFTDDPLTRLLHRHGLSIHRPKHTLKGKRDEAAYRTAKKRLQRENKTP